MGNIRMEDIKEGTIFVKDNNYYIVVGCKEVEKPLKLYDAIQILLGNDMFYSLVYTIVRLDKVTVYKKSIQKNPYFYMKEATSLVYVKTINISRFKIDLTKRKLIDGMISDNIEEVKKKPYERAKEYFRTVCKSLKELKIGQILQGQKEVVFMGIDLYGFLLLNDSQIQDISYEELKNYKITDKVLNKDKTGVSFGLPYKEWILRLKELGIDWVNIT